MKASLLVPPLVFWVAHTIAANVTIIDGDTLKIDGATIRIVGIDAPESYRSRCENELVLGLKAKERLRGLVDFGDVTYERAGLDRYQRVLAEVFVEADGRRINVGETLIKEGYALRYEKGWQTKLDRLQTWCGPASGSQKRSRMKNAPG